jgi:hypothetical protein
LIGVCSNAENVLNGTSEFVGRQGPVVPVSCDLEKRRGKTDEREEQSDGKEYTAECRRPFDVVVALQSITVEKWCRIGVVEDVAV